MKKVTYNSTESMRLDAYITSLYQEKSRAYVQRWIEEQGIKVNGEIVKSSYKLRENDQISIEDREEKTIAIEKQAIPISILYQDEDVAVIVKPRGMVVHPSNGHYEGGTLVHALLYHMQDLSSINGVIRPGIVHRIDKDTSGLLVIAKNDAAHLHLSQQLKEKTMYRCYYALVEGVIPHTDLFVDAPIGKDRNNRLKQAVDVYHGKEARTHLHVMERYAHSTFVEARLETGRTHQIRVHLAYIHYPIIGDTTYGSKKKAITDQGQMLHAFAIRFLHPRTKQEMYFETPVDEEFARVQAILKNEK